MDVTIIIAERKKYLVGNIFVKGNMAQKALHDAEGTREEILSEGEAA